MLKYFIKSLVSLGVVLLMSGCNGSDSPLGAGGEFTKTLEKRYVKADVPVVFYMPSSVSSSSSSNSVDSNSSATASVYSINNYPSKGSLDIIGGSATYTASVGNSGSDSFSIKEIGSDGEEYIYIQPIEIIAVNSEPILKGNPTTNIKKGQKYYFRPTVIDADNSANQLTFEISNKPFWASFNSFSGELTGTANTNTEEVCSTDQNGTTTCVKNPVETTFSNVTISVKDGTNYVSMEPFSIIVTP